jgi:uncharacterized membrane protein
MRNMSEQPQAQIEEERGYAPQQPPEYNEGDGLPGGYQQPGYAPGQPYPANYQGPQQHYGYQRPYYALGPGDVSPFEMTSMGLRARTAGVLCYLFAWVGGLVFLLLERQNRFVRFHAAQSLLFFGTMSLLGWVCSLFPFALFGLGGVVGLVGFIGWIVLMVAAHRGRYYKLPLFGDLAEQLANRFAL